MIKKILTNTIALFIIYHRCTLLFIHNFEAIKLSSWLLMDGEAMKNVIIFTYNILIISL